MAPTDPDGDTMLGVPVSGDSFDRERSRQRVRAQLLGEPEQAPKIGPFFVLHRLGQGAMGVVYAAFDPRLNRRVALKVLHGSGGGRDAADLSARMLREARALAALSHPNVVGVHEVGEHGGGVYLAMEFVDGQTLHQWLGEHPRSWTDVLSLMIGAGQGLAAAHGSGLVHRDFKPDNVLIGHDGVARVADFGLARATTATTQTIPAGSVDADADAASPQQHDSDALTQTGTLVGTPRYMAPEQHRAEPVGPLADQYSFCLTLHEALAGTFGLPLKLGALIQAKTHGQIPRLERDATGGRIPAWLGRAIDTGLQPDPTARHADMAALLTALQPAPRAPKGRLATAITVSAIVVPTAAVAVAAARMGTPAPTVGAVPTCPDFSGPMQSAWSAQTRDRIEAAVTATGVQNPDAVTRHITQSLDGFAAQWGDARHEVCERDLTHIEAQGVVSRRLECLAVAAARLTAVVDILAGIDVAALPTVPAVLEVLGDPTACTTAELAYERGFRPTSPDALDKQQQARSELAVLEALGPAGRMAQLRDGLDAFAAAHDLAANPIVAQTYYRLRALAEQAGDARLEAAYLGLEAGLRSGSDAVLISAYAELANRLNEEHQWDLALHAASQGIALADRMIRESAATERQASRAGFTIQLGDIHGAAEHDAQAIAAYQEALEDLATAAPEAVDLRAKAYNNLAELHRTRGRYDEAIALYGRAIELFEASTQPREAQIALTVNNRGSAEFERGDFEQARRDFLRAGELIAPQGPWADSAGLIAFNLGIIALSFADYDAAREHLDHAYAAWSMTPLHSKLFCPVALAGQASLAHRTGDDAKALALHDTSVADLEALPGAPATLLAALLAERGVTWLELGDAQGALEQTDRALTLFEQSIGADTFGASNTWAIHGHALQKLDQRPAAAAAYDRAAAALAKLGNPTHPGLAEVHAGRAALAERNGDVQAAARADAALATVLDAHPGLYVWSRRGLSPASR